MFFLLFLFFLFFLVKFVSPGCEGVALCIQECGPCVIVYSGMGAWECVKHEKVHSHSVPFCKNNNNSNNNNNNNNNSNNNNNNIIIISIIIYM